MLSEKDKDGLQSGGSANKTTQDGMSRISVKIFYVAHSFLLCECESISRFPLHRLQMINVTVRIWLIFALFLWRLSPVCMCSIDRLIDSGQTSLSVPLPFMYYLLCNRQLAYLFMPVSVLTSRVSFGLPSFPPSLPFFLLYIISDCLWCPSYLIHICAQANENLFWSCWLLDLLVLWFVAQ